MKVNRCLIIGDSMSQSYGANEDGYVRTKIHEIYGNHVTVDILGFYGATTAHMLNDLIPQAQEKFNYTGLPYDLIIIFCGPNDVIRMHFNQLKIRSHTIVSECGKMGHRVVWAIGDPDITPILSSGSLLLKPIKFMIKQIIKTYYPDVKKFISNLENEYPYFSILHVMSRNNSTDPFVLEPEKYFYNDQYHPNKLGYNYIFDKLKSLELNGSDNF